MKRFLLALAIVFTLSLSYASSVEHSPPGNAEIVLAPVDGAQIEIAAIHAVNYDVFDHQKSPPALCYGLHIKIPVQVEKAHYFAFIDTHRRLYGNMCLTTSYLNYRNIPPNHQTSITHSS